MTYRAAERALATAVAVLTALLLNAAQPVRTRPVVTATAALSAAN